MGRHVAVLVVANTNDFALFDDEFLRHKEVLLVEVYALLQELSSLVRALLDELEVVGPVPLIPLHGILLFHLHLESVVRGLEHLAEGVQQQNADD